MSTPTLAQIVKMPVGPAQARALNAFILADRESAAPKYVGVQPFPGTAAGVAPVTLSGMAPEVIARKRGEILYETTHSRESLAPPYKLVRVAPNGDILPGGLLAQINAGEITGADACGTLRAWIKGVEQQTAIAGGVRGYYSQDNWAILMSTNNPAAWLQAVGSDAVGVSDQESAVKSQMMDALNPLSGAIKGVENLVEDVVDDTGRILNAVTEGIESVESEAGWLLPLALGVGAVIAVSVAVTAVRVG